MLPWDIIDGGMKTCFFRREFDKALREEWTLPQKQQNRRAASGPELMRPSPRLSRAMLATAAAALGWALVVPFTGGFSFEASAIRFSSRTARNPLIIALVATLAGVALASPEARQRYVSGATYRARPRSRRDAEPPSGDGPGACGRGCVPP